MKKESKYFLIGILLFLFEITVLFKLFSVYGIYPSLIKVFLTIVALEFPLKKSLKFAFFFGLFEDLYMAELFVYNVIVNLIIVYVVNEIKNHIDFGIYFYGISLIAFISIADLLVKSILIFAKTDIFYISANFLFYVLLNTILYIPLKVLLGR